MNPCATRLGIVCAILVLFLVLGLVLIPVLDAELRRATARKVAAAANDNARTGALKPERQVG